MCLESRAQMAFTALCLLPLVRKVCAHRDVPVEVTSHGSCSLVSWWKGKVGREKGEVLQGGSEENTHHFWALPCHVWTEHCILSNAPLSPQQLVKPSSLFCRWAHGGSGSEMTKATAGQSRQGSKPGLSDSGTYPL